MEQSVPPVKRACGRRVAPQPAVSFQPQRVASGPGLGDMGKLLAYSAGVQRAGWMPGCLATSGYVGRRGRISGADAEDGRARARHRASCRRSPSGDGLGCGQPTQRRRPSIPYPAKSSAEPSGCVAVRGRCSNAFPGPRQQGRRPHAAALRPPRRRPAPPGLGASLGSVISWPMTNLQRWGLFDAVQRGWRVQYIAVPGNGARSRTQRRSASLSG